MCFDGVLLQFLLPLIIEKLDSDVQSAKLDSLQTLVKTSLMIYCWLSIRKSSKSEEQTTEQKKNIRRSTRCVYGECLAHFYEIITFLSPLQTASVSHYQHKDLADFLEGLWASLRREVSLTHVCTKSWTVFEFPVCNPTPSLLFVLEPLEVWTLNYKMLHQ